MKVSSLLSYTVSLATLCGAIGAQVDVVNSLRSELPFDENNKLARHQFIVKEGVCANFLRKLSFDDLQYGYDVRAVIGEAADELFPNGGKLKEDPEGIDDCRAVCLERGVDRSVVGAAMPVRHYTGEQADMAAFVHERCRRVEICLLNYYSPNHKIRSVWLHPTTGERKPHIEIDYGERNTRCVESFIGHKFEFENVDTGEVIDSLTVEHVTVYAVGDDPDYLKEGRNFTQEIEDTLQREWDRHNRVTRRFSAIGFKKGRLPDDVFASMGAFYYNNAEFRVKEEWSGKGVFVNWWETDAYFVQIPWNLKRLWQSRLLQLVEAWTGVELEQTDMYGLRRYESGARLLTHVDREATHAASLIVNIAQGNLAEPWPVEVHDHADRLHEVTMEPGDVVYYESAKCLHARNKPLVGDGAYYVNLFTHYRPVGDPKWFEKDTDEWVPEALIDVGECKLTGSIEMIGEGAVTCDNSAIGPYLSPTLFTATSGDDLIDWWRKVGPTEDVSSEEVVAGAGSPSGAHEEL